MYLKKLALASVAVLVIAGLSITPALAASSSTSAANAVTNTSSTSSSGINAPLSSTSGAAVSDVSPSASLTFNSKATPPSLTPLQTPTGTIPQIFGSTGRTANAAGLGITAGFIEACPLDVATNGSEMTTQKFVGASKMTTGHWTAFPDYVEQGSNTRQIIQHVGLRLPGRDQADGYEFACLGVITMEADQSHAQDVDLSTITGDAARFVGTLSDATDSGDGTSHVYMIFVPQSISADFGMVAGGGSIGFSPSGTSLVGAATSAIGAAAGIGYNKGYAFTKTQVGATFVLVAIKKPGTGGVKLSYHMLEKLYDEKATLQPPTPSSAEEVAKIDHNPAQAVK